MPGLDLRARRRVDLEDRALLGLVEGALDDRDEPVVADLLGVDLVGRAGDLGHLDGAAATAAALLAALLAAAAAGRGAAATALALLGLGHEDVDGRALLDDLLLRGDLAGDLALGVGGRGRGGAEREPGLAQGLLGLAGRLADDAGHGDLAVADGDEDRDLAVLLGGLAGLGRLAHDGAGRALGSTFSLTCGASRSPASVIACSASKAEGLPITSGTSVLLGRKRKSSRASSASSGITIATHHGSHGFWRKTAWLGSSGPVTGGAPPPGILSLSRLTFMPCMPPPATCGPRTIGLDICTPPGPMCRLPL